jgi:hypothetical protein
MTLDMWHQPPVRKGFTIEQVALVTGHKDWKMPRRYSHLKPEALHNIRVREVVHGTPDARMTC